MFNYLLSLEYDGTNYCGWIIQKNNSTIQGELEKAIKAISKNNDFKLRGASKTDSGVHALDQKVLLTIDYQPNDLDYFINGINNVLPMDIHIKKIKAVNNGFDIRKVKYKKYVYTIQDQEYNLLTQRFELDNYQFKNIDTNKLQEICDLFVGEHDFKLFSGLTTKELDEIKTIRAIDSIVVKREDNRIKIYFQAKGFVRYQIRMIVGACLYAYIAKRITKAEIVEKLTGIGEKWPIVIDAKGLLLLEIQF